MGTVAAPDWQEVILAEGQSISMEHNSQLWGDHSSFAYGIEIPYIPNKRLFGTSDEIFGSSIYSALYKRPARLWASGVILFSGHIDIDDEVDVSGDAIEVNILSGRKSFNDMLDGVNAQDVDIYFGDMRSGFRKDGTHIDGWHNGSVRPYEGEKDNATLLAERFPGKNIQNVQIGYANAKTAETHIGAKLITKLPVGTVSFPDGLVHDTWKTNSYTSIAAAGAVKDWVIPVTIEFPQVLVPHPEGLQDYVNIREGYRPGADRYLYPYCNISLCAQKWVEEGDGKWEKRRGYTDVQLDHYRYNSSPCFFVLFWLEQLLDIYLNVDYDISNLTRMHDLLNLCFVNTRCTFESIKGSLNSTFDFAKAGVLTSKGVDKNGNPQYDAYIEYTGAKKYQAVVEVTDVKPLYNVHDQLRLVGFSRLGSTTACMAPQILCQWSSFESSNVLTENAYATSENFPDVDASDVLTSLENAFGFKFTYDETNNHVDVVVYREVLSKHTSSTVKCVVSDVHKRENLRTGFRLKYSASQAFERNVFTKEEQLVQGGEETAYNYNDYRNVTMIQGRGLKDYVSLIHGLGSYDETLYVSKLTGNAFRIKVDKDAQSETKWYPSLFEVGGYRDVEYGQCEDDGVFKAVVDEKVIGFSPIMVNDTNFENEKQFGSDSEASKNAPPAYRLFVDKEVHRISDYDTVPIGKYMDGDWAANRMELLLGDMATSDYIESIRDGKVIPSNDDGCSLSCRYGLNFPQGKDSGSKNSNPFNADEASFVLGFLRAGSKEQYGSQMYFHSENYDDEGHAIAAWVDTYVGGECITADSVDVFGNFMGDISLKLKAEKPLRSENGRTADEKPYDAQGNVDYENGNPRYYPVDASCANRGLFDRCWTEYAWFITHCKVAVLTIPPGGIELVDLLAMRDDEWYVIGEYRGLLNKYSVAIDDGEIGEVTIELLYI